MATDDSPEPTRDPLSELLWQPGRKLDDDTFLEDSLVEESIPGDRATVWVEPSAQQLEAYRRSELKSAEREAVEDALLRSSAVRSRLAALSDLEPQTASSSSRERVLAAFDREFAAAESNPAKTSGTGARVLPWRRVRKTQHAGLPTSRARSLRPAWAALAAALLAVVVWLGSPATEPFPEGLHWQIQAQGAAEVRSHSNEAASAGVDPLQLAPSTLLRLEASPSRALNDVDVSLFQLRSGELPKRLSLSDSMLALDRGAARIEAPTADLLGSDPESGWLILVLSRPGSEPSPDELAQALLPTSSAQITMDPVASPVWRAYPIPYVLSDS